MLKRYRHITTVAATIIVLVLVCVQCMDKPSGKKQTADVRGPDYAGAEACAKCHSDIHRSYLLAAHTNSSARASLQSIKGSFEEGSNSYRYRDSVLVKMEKRGNGLFQVAYINNREHGAYPFGPVIGSGRKAQTYLYWYGENVFQLPVSWSMSAGNWVNSPNYPPDKVRFDRLINVGCFECHGSYIKLKGTQEEGTRLVDYFDKSMAIYGIDCERCHGPAKQHVEFHEKNPQEKKANFIASYASLPRQAKLDLCAQCHSGAHPIKQTIFNFKPGDTLSSYFTRTPGDDASASELDVHGNQYQLMAASQCFIKSNTLDCASCHNSHKAERDDMKVFSTRCMNCHGDVKHSEKTIAAVAENALVDNCIDCHMPASPSRVIGMKSENSPEAAPNLVRTHFISVYQEATQRYIDSLKKRN